MFKHTAIALSVLAAAGMASANSLTVYTYSSFVSEWGPGPQIKERFEAQCGCEVNFIGLDDGVSLLNRLHLEGSGTQADILLGIDDALIAETRELGLVAEHGLDLTSLSLPYDWQDDAFVPYDYGHFAFVYDQTRIDDVPSSLQELVYESSASIIYQDPRVSTPGQGLMLWMKSVFGDEADQAWRELQSRVVTVTPGWSEAYALFQEGESDMVLSYTTSPAYHMTWEDTDQYQAAEFSEGHYAQIEVAAMLTTTDQPELARDFLAFLVSRPAQDVLPGTNWMWPVLEDADVPEAFGQMAQPASLYFDSEIVADNRRAWLREWRNAASQ